MAFHRPCKGHVHEHECVLLAGIRQARALYLWCPVTMIMNAEILFLVAGWIRPTLSALDSCPPTTGLHATLISNQTTTCQKANPRQQDFGIGRVRLDVLAKVSNLTLYRQDGCPGVRCYSCTDRMDVLVYGAIAVRTGWLSWCTVL